MKICTPNYLLPSSFAVFAGLMSAEPIRVDAVSASSSLWDRVSTWASEHKVAAYTIAGTVVIVSGAGIVYYLSDSRRTSSTGSDKKKSKKERRLEKQQAKEQQEKGGVKLGDEESGMI